MSKEAVDAILYGTKGERIEMHRENEFGSGRYFNDFEGIVNNLERRFRETGSEWMKEEIATVMNGVECPDCHGHPAQTHQSGGHGGRHCHQPVLRHERAGGTGIPEIISSSPRCSTASATAS